jgi:hypothetical protein
MIVVFNDSFGSDAFEETIRAVNIISKDKISYEFIDDFESDEGEFAWNIWRVDK